MSCRHNPLERCYVCGRPAERARIPITVQRAARLCRVSVPTVYRWMKERKVEWIELPNGRRRIYLDSLFRERDHTSKFIR
jgi:hypothetical protein